jgi:hypothetical protein
MATGSRSDRERQTARLREEDRERADRGRDLNFQSGFGAQVRAMSVLPAPEERAQQAALPGRTRPARRVRIQRRALREGVPDGADPGSGGPTQR